MFQVYPLAMNDFFLQVYRDLLIPPMVGLGIVCFVAAAVRLFFGHREGAEGLAKVGAALFLVAFAPFIITTVWGALTAAGGGQ
ncbi:MAG: hypothetical protein M3Q65_00610 [Chloroflexota bacterium]|nr:hypothetical protein [Chloroflexota bacterium]